MQIDDEHEEAIGTSPMILEYVDDKVYAPRTSAHETLETVVQVEDGVGKFFKIPFFNCTRLPNRVFMRRIAVALGIDLRNNAESVLSSHTFVV
ncbi:hypothetical protein DPMN_048849 [Dreissena polymorpha]|uniref:Uncharacterized protein n=1 Tax=Dreissena polymorpha TaxID=45954 RepID=A0A9D4DCD8_DREPO|nr:hypothetical protein DPMN_048849 [Dreissena polymorpha]